LSYWIKDNDKWILNTSIVNVSGGVYTINIAGQVDDVRFYPQQTQIITATHEDLLGVTSLSSAADVVQYYDYDDFQRLAHVIDNDRNVIKKISYKYYQHSITGDASPSWKATGKKRCVIGSDGPTGYEEIEVLDINPASPTYKEMQWIDNGLHIADCPLCEGNDRKWLNNTCEAGFLVEGETTRIGDACRTRYWYEFSDGSISRSYYRVTSPCQL
jgi:hypothetical protein